MMAHTKLGIKVSCIIIYQFCGKASIIDNIYLVVWPVADEWFWHSLYTSAIIGLNWKWTIKDEQMFLLFTNCVSKRRDLTERIPGPSSSSLAHVIEFGWCTFIQVQKLWTFFTVHILPGFWRSSLWRSSRTNDSLTSGWSSSRRNYDNLQESMFPLFHYWCTGAGASQAGCGGVSPG